MEEVFATLCVFVSLCRLLSEEMAHGLCSGMTWGLGIHLFFWHAIMSGSLALLVKYLAALRVVPLYKVLSGSLCLLLVSWYVDRILKHNTYLMVRAVGVAIIFCAALGVVIVSDAGFARRQEQVQASAPAQGETLAQADYEVHRD
ncbi:hypothetical protein GMLC_35570 [Geomonas limicola]|uniref:Uncharacterized protein n=1 Tax=Geomonas limicola TaxID=2740186 RepID=A0A6V8NBI0_9BACT|nr:hypothetical protein [Geomonas limicola]GFO69978.1 hypothetical protein GMLC_35570 [Geomonas limicola]